MRGACLPPNDCLQYAAMKRLKCCGLDCSRFARCLPAACTTAPAWWCVRGGPLACQGAGGWRWGWRREARLCARLDPPVPRGSLRMDLDP